MALEIERKFLLKNEAWRELADDGTLYRQGYLTEGEGKSSVRIRIEGNKGKLNIKGVTIGSSRLEYEYDVPLEEAEELLDKLCHQPLIEKRRFLVKHQNLVWEIDEFMGANDGLVVAEVELSHENQAIELPEWIGKEVTEDKRYYNACLVNNPFKDW